MCEFYTTPAGEIAIVSENNETTYYTNSNHELTERLLVYIKEYYPKAVKALEEEYKKSINNKRFFEYKIVHRWLRCNCGTFDTLSEDYEGGEIHVEQVPCPLRGECKLEGIVCMAKKKSIITERQMEIVKLLNSGRIAKEVAVDLGISVHTVNKTVQNIKKRTGISKVSQLKTEHEN